MRRYGGTRKLAALAMCMSMATVSGCAINPTPLGYGTTASADYTLSIIRHVRCEARDAMVRQATRVIRLYAEQQDDAKARKLAEDLELQPGKIRTNFKVWDIDPLANVQAAIFLSSAIGLEFVLTGEVNNNSVFTPAFNNATAMSKLSLKTVTQTADLKRRNQRTIDLTESSFSRFQYILCPQDEYELDYLEREIRKPASQALREQEKSERPDWFYPSRGNIQLSKTIRTYVDYVLLDTLAREQAGWAGQALLTATREVTGDRRDISGDDNDTRNRRINSLVGRLRSETKYLDNCESGDPKCRRDRSCYEETLKRAGSYYINNFYGGSKKSSASLVVTDVLKFTTKLSAGLNPVVELAAATGGLNVDSLGLNLSGYREDTHQLTVVLKAPGKRQPEKTPKTISVGGDASTAALVIQVPGTTELPEPYPDCLPQKVARKMSARGSRSKDTKPTATQRPARAGLFPESQETDAQREQTEEELLRLLDRTNLIRLERGLKELVE